MGSWESLQFYGFEIKNNILQPFSYTIDLPTKGGVQGSLSLMIPYGTIICSDVLGFNTMDAPFCDVVSVQGKWPGHDTFEDVNLLVS
jgi:hypothetical protein